MPKLPHLHLHRVFIDDQPLPLVINARSQAAVRDYFVDRHIRIERLTPEEAFQAGVNGAVIETVGATEQIETDASSAEPGLFDAPTESTQHPAASETGMTSRPIDEPGPGYSAALTVAATL